MIPTHFFIRHFDGFQFLHRKQNRFAHFLSFYLAILKKALPHINTPHIKAFGIVGIKTPANNQFRAAAADINHQALIDFIIQAMRDP